MTGRAVLAAPVGRAPGRSVAGGGRGAARERITNGAEQASAVGDRQDDRYAWRGSQAGEHQIAKARQRALATSSTIRARSSSNTVVS